MLLQMKLVEVNKYEYKLDSIDLCDVSNSLVLKKHKSPNTFSDIYEQHAVYVVNINTHMRTIARDA